ncbi:pyocin knob domain-containing protein [Chryseobacterium indoltheticum]|uniref:pyocin knob domain-containing protein n=1 Tax=Chryseobacterium indoltheticum TaxID=254 RepID=UPI003F495AD8
MVQLLGMNLLLREWSSTVNVPYTGATNDIHLNGKKLNGANSVNITQNSAGLYGSYVGLESKSSDGNTIYLGGVADSVGSYIGQSRYISSNLYQSNKTYSSFIKFGNAGDIYFYGNTGLTANTNYSPTELAKIDSTGRFVAQAIVKSGGLATQFLKADGSIDSNAYSLSSHSHTFSSLTAKPTTAAGYGITDVPRQGILGGDINSIRSNDTRNTNPLPSTDLKSGVWFDFKGVSTIGLTNNFSWASVMTFVPYSDDTGNANSAYRLAQSGDELNFQNYTAGVWGKWRKIWTDKHFSQIEINNWNTAFNWGNHANAGYLTNAAFSNYYTKNESLNLFVGNNGVETISNTKTFTDSPVIPPGILGTHAVNLNQLNSKANAQENATAVGFSSGNVPTTDGGSYPYMYHNSGLYVALATQSYVQTNFLSTPNGISIVISGSNLNNYLKTGFYMGSGLNNAPFNNNGWWYVTVETHDATWVKQTATSFGSGNVPNITYQRTMNGGSWSDWAQIWTTQDFTVANIQQWNYAYQYGLKVNETFSVNMSSGMAITDDGLDSESGLTDLNEKNLVAAKRGDYYKYGSSIQGFEGLNYEYKKQKFGLGRVINDTDKLTVEGSVKASKNFKSEGEKPDTLFIPNGELASLRDEIVNDQSDYAIRLDPHEYEVDPSGFLGIDDRNRLIHVIGEQIKMTVDFKKFILNNKSLFIILINLEVRWR